MRTRGLVVGFAFALSACSVRGAPESFSYHYFKEQRPLKLDASRVAVLQTRQATTEALNQALVRNGLAPGETRTVSVPRWSLATTPATNRTESATRDLVSRLASDNSFDFVAPVFFGDDGGPVIVTPDILIGFEPTTTEQQAESILAGITNAVILHRNWGNMKGVYHLHTAAKHGLDVLALANQLAERTEVKFAEPDMIFTGHSDLIPNDPDFSNLWGIQNTGQLGGIAGMDMKGTQAWDITTGSSSIIVVIIDVGVQPDHPDIHQIPGTNFTSDASFDGGPVNACDNHGTAVAGCVSGIINNSLGVVGIAPGCLSASARAFIANSACDNSWTGQSSWTVNALAWAQSIGARISNNSNNYGFQSSAIAQEYSYTRGVGMVHFACAGNNASSTITYPASLPDVNAVAALNESGSLASFSNYGTGLAFSAPGQDIYTTDRTGTNGWASGDYTWAYGTSFASPYAAGVAALVLSVNASLNATNVEQIMQASCIDLGSPGYDTTYGWGFVNAYGAVQLAAACSLTVASSNPNSGVAIVVSPSDLAGRGGGTTPFNLNYTTNSAVQLTAPASIGGSYFVKWQRNATDYSTDLVTTVTMDKNYTMMAVYFTPPPLASFTATPTNGIEPVMVTFSDTSSGPITTRFWNFGDGGTTNVTTNVLVHTYSAGSYDVTLVVTGPGGVSTNIWPNYINVLSAFQNWQIQYFGSTNNPAAAPDADPLGKGMSNTNQFLAGLNPTNPASVFRIVSIQVQGANAVIAWSTVGGKTNIVQGGIGDTDNNDPSYTNLYWDMSDPIIVSGSGDAVTNFLDDGTWWGDYSNYPVHYYRVRLVP